MPESQRKKHRESTSSTSSISSISSITDLKVNYYPPQPFFGPFNKSLSNISSTTDNNDNNYHNKPLKKPKFITAISAKPYLNNNNSNSNNTPVPTIKKKHKHITTNIIAAFSAPQHLKTELKHTIILKEKSLNNLVAATTNHNKKHNIKTPPSRSISRSISIPNSTTTEEICDIVDIKLEELDDNDHDTDDINTDSEEDDEDSDEIFPLTIPHLNELQTIDPNKMSLRAQLWSVLLDFNFKEHQHKEYIKEIEKGNSTHYNSKILRDAQQTFLTSSEFNSRVSEHQIVRILNAFVIKNNRAYCQGMDAIAGIMLYVMHETYAFQLLNILMSIHFPLYFKSDSIHKSNNNIVTINEYNNKKHTSLIGAYAGTYLAYDILKIWDIELFQYLSSLHPYQYIFPLIASFQAISQPLAQVQKLWDYLFAYGVYLNPIVSVAQLIVNRKKILIQTIPNLLMGLLSQRKWMNYRLNAKNVIKISSLIANKLSSNKQYKDIWMNVQLHSSDFNTAYKIKIYYDLKLKSEGFAMNNNNNNNNNNNDDDDDSISVESSDWNQSDSNDSTESDTDTDTNTNTDTDHSSSD